EDGVIDLNAGVVLGNWAAGCLLFALVIAGQVRAYDLPGHALICSFEQHLRRKIQRVGIMGRENNRLRPLETILLVYRCGANRVQGPRGNILCLSGMVIVAGDRAAIRAGVDNFRIVRIGCNVSAFSTADRVPIRTVNAATAGGGGGSDAAVVLPRS